MNLLLLAFKVIFNLFSNKSATTTKKVSSQTIIFSVICIVLAVLFARLMVVNKQINTLKEQKETISKKLTDSETEVKKLREELKLAKAFEEANVDALVDNCKQTNKIENKIESLKIKTLPKKRNVIEHKAGDINYSPESDLSAAPPENSSDVSDIEELDNIVLAGLNTAATCANAPEECGELE